MITVYKSKQIVCEHQVIDGYLKVENGIIKSVSSKTDAKEIVDLKDSMILPGIFDTHNHGVFGFNLMESVNKEKDIETVKGYLKGLASQGVTSILPTADISMFSAIADLSKMDEGAQIRGIHSEGPWLNRVGEKGIKTGWPEVSLATAKKMVKEAKGQLKLVALAPEIEGIDKIRDYFLSEGITIAYAHSDLGYEEAKKAFDQGITVSTHTGNVMTGLHHRDIGGLGAALTHPNVDCEIICDGMHVSLEMIDLYFKIKDKSRFMMISDCTPLSGAPVGKYLMFKDMYANVTEEGYCLTDTGRLMGSTQPVIFGIKNLVTKLNIPIVDVMQMASLNPSRKYSVGDSKGSLTVGKDADFIIVDKDFKVLETYVKGHKIFDLDSDTDLFNMEMLEMGK